MDMNLWLYFKQFYNQINTLSEFKFDLNKDQIFGCWLYYFITEIVAEKANDDCVQFFLLSNPTNVLK